MCTENVCGDQADNAGHALAGEPDAPSVRTELLVRVSDSGAGIDPERISDLFTRGWTTKNEAGHGIGLALVRQAVNRNGGTIDVSCDEELGGAAVAVRLPLPRSTIDAPAPATAAQADR